MSGEISPWDRTCGARTLAILCGAGCCLSAGLGARLLFLHGSADTLWKRGRIPRAQQQFITGYAIPRFGPTLEAVHQYFVNEQDEMRRPVQRSAMTSMEVDADADFGAVVASACEFWLS